MERGGGSGAYRGRGADGGRRGGAASGAGAGAGGGRGRGREGGGGGGGVSGGGCLGAGGYQPYYTRGPAVDPTRGFRPFGAYAAQYGGAAGGGGAHGGTGVSGGSSGGGGYGGSAGGAGGFGGRGGYGGGNAGEGGGRGVYGGGIGESGYGGSAGGAGGFGGRGAYAGGNVGEGGYGGRGSEGGYGGGHGGGYGGRGGECGGRGSREYGGAGGEYATGRGGGGAVQPGGRGSGVGEYAGRGAPYGGRGGGRGGPGGGDGGERGRGRGRGRGGPESSGSMQFEILPESVDVAVIGPDLETQISQRLSRCTLKTTGERQVPMKRPDEGGKLCVRTTKLRVNHFPVGFKSDSLIRHYDIDIKPREHPTRPVKLSKSNLELIQNKLFTSDPSEFPISMTAYDGEKNIFSAAQLPTGKFQVGFDDGEDTKHRVYDVTIKLVNELELSKLKDYITGKLFSTPRDILQGMDVVMKENPARNMIPAGRGFHLTEMYREDDLGHGIIASRGFQHSLKPTFQGLVLCLDYTVIAFRKRLPVIDFLVQHIPGFNLNDFRRFRSKVEEALKGMKVTVTHRLTKQKYVVAGLTRDNTRQLAFEVEDPDGNAPPTRVTLVDYFRRKYEKDIMYIDIPALELGKKKNYVPMEFCLLVEGQIYQKEKLERLDKNAAICLRKMSLAQPKVRENSINDMVHARGGPCGGETIRNFGIEVDMNMTSVTGRVIKAPKLKLGTSGRPIGIEVDREKCQWNLLGKQVVEGKVINRWAILDFSASDKHRLIPDPFITKFIARCKTLGMQMERPIFYQQSGMDKFSNTNALSELLETANRRTYDQCQGQLQFLLCIMSGKDPGYKHLKWISETRVGVVTQCCLSGPANKGNDQYLANLALKVNAKLGGSNVELVDRLPYIGGADHVMFLGADVNHPASKNTTSPSMAAVVGTVNWPAANCYVARVRAQEHRCERIVSFGRMCLELVETYAQLNKSRPGRIVIFRDGVSEGQFDMVLNEELIDLKRTFLSVNYNPTITVIVAQKRHQTRLFPVNQMDAGTTGNVPPGTVVDTTIVHPFEFDFYLCSHYGGLGTSKPTHYHVLWDEHGFTSDELQTLIYSLCFTFARCTKPVSLVPPVYYADLAAYRGRLYHESAVDGQSTSGSVASASSSSSSKSLAAAAPTFDRRSYKLHAGLENMMFFI